MAKEFHFFDSAGTRRRVKEAYFYDSAGDRRQIKTGLFYDAQGNRRIFFEGGIAPPAQGYFPGSNFTMQVGENATYTGASVGTFGEIVPDAGAPGNFALYPTTDATAHLAYLFYADRNKSTSVFRMYYYLDPFPNPAATSKFWGFNVLNAAGALYTSMLRTSATETVLNKSIEHTWPYIVPLTVGSIYKFLFHELAANTSIVAGAISGYTGFSSGLGSLATAFGTCANTALTTRAGWTITQFNTDGETALVELKGPPGSTDPGRAFIVGVTTTAAGIQGLTADQAYSYTWDNVNKLARWEWDETTKFTNGNGYTLLLG